MLMIFSSDGKPKSEEAKRATMSWGVDSVDGLVKSVSEYLAGEKEPSEKPEGADNA